jgi:hypothetical protein
VFIFIGKAIAAAVAGKALIAAHSPQDPATAPPQPTQGPQSKSFFNPQISLVTDFRIAAVNSDPSVRKEATIREAELGLVADVDPFLRAEAYIAFANEDGEAVAELEEGFARYNHLGRGLSAKFGKIAAGIGRIQRNHVDQLNWMDYPFMIQDMLGEEGLRAGGASFSYLLPGDRFNEFTVEAMDAHDSVLFSRSHAASPTMVGAYRTFFDFSQDASAQLGLSYANGPAGPGNDRSQLLAAEFTYKWQPGTPGKSLNFETEGYWGKLGGSGTGTKFGGFAGLTYELKPRLFGYARYDYSETPGSTDIRRGWTFGATLKVTEFHHWRAEFQRIESNFAPARNVLNFQFQYIIGAHPAHKY